MPAPAATLCLTLALLSLLSACTSVAPLGSPTIDTSAHEQALIALEDWVIRGRLNIRSPDEARTVSLRWEQHADTFDINMSGFIGIGTMLLQGDDTGAQLQKGDAPPYYAADLESLSADWLGHEYPAERILFWIRGLPAPGHGFQALRDESGLLSTLQQGEWQLVFDRYSEHAGLWLPGRIRMDNGEIQLTFLIQDWGLPA